MIGAEGHCSLGANSESTTQVLQFYHLDRLGSRLVTNASDGSTAGEQESLPFGTALGAGIGGNNRRFTSYDRSTTTKLDYAVNRSYHAGLGRFTQVNPIGDPQSQTTLRKKPNSSRIKSRGTQ
jgi:uncharacterized protein RhaS with RHS repeats